MIQGIYQGAAAMNALEQWQSAISQNLAAGSVTGFKKEETTFSGVPAGSTRLSANDFSPSMTRLVPLAHSKISIAQGNLRQTGKDLDLAVQGPGFFQVQTPGGVGYTRNGEFHVDANGKIVTNQGQAMLGESGPLSVDPKLGPVTVDRTGQISQGETAVGKIALYDAGANGAMERSSDGLLVPKDGGTPARVEHPEVLQGYVEESNVTPLQEMVNLIAVSRAYEISQKLVTSLDQSARSAIDVLGTP